MSQENTQYKIKFMEHSFNIELASKYGVEEAVVIQNLFFWINKNVANDKNFFDGRYWTYNSTKAFAKLFPYLNESKLFRILKSLQDNDIIIKGNYNKEKFDRTGWYAFTDNGISILEKLNFHFSKMQNGFNENEETIPDNKQQIINTDNKEKESKEKKCYDKNVDILYGLYPSKCPKRNVSLGKCFKDKDRLRKLLKNHSFEMLKFTIEKEINEKYNKSYMSNFSTFLNNLPDYGYNDNNQSNDDTKKYNGEDGDKLILNGITYK